MFSLILSILICFVFILVIFAIAYFLIYQYMINRQLKKQTGKFHMPTPFIAIISAVIVLLICVILFLFITRSYNQLTYDELDLTNAAVYTDFDYFTPDTISNHYAAIYKMDEDIPGYNKYKKTDGDFHYTYYLSVDDYNTLHPKFIIFVTYTGTDYDQYVLSNGFSYDNDGGYSYEIYEDTELPEYSCFVGNADGECNFNIFIGTYSTENYRKSLELRENPEILVNDTFSLANSSSCFSLDLDAFGDYNVQNVSLYDVTLDGIKLGDFIDSIDLSCYTKSDRYSGDYKYKFENLILDTNADNNITYVFGDMESCYLSIGDVEDIYTIDKVKSVLGDEFKLSTYDYAQSLKKCTYSLPDEAIQISFIYYEFNDSVSANQHKIAFVEMKCE